MTYIAVGFVAPIVVTLVAVLVEAFAVGDLPDRIAVHWNASGEADGWGSPWVIVALTVILGLSAAALSTVNYRQLTDGAPGGTFRWVSTTAAATATGTGVILAGIMVTQADGDSTSPTALIGVAVAAAVVVGAIGWFVQPTDPPTGSGRHPEAMGLAPGGRAVWLHTETTSRFILIAGAAAVVFASVIGLLTAMNGGSTASLWAAVAIIVIILVAMSTVVGYHVRIDSSGLRVRSIAGLPRWHIAADEIDDVTVVDVRAIGDFGGYGVRYSRGRTGVILRSGPAVQVTRTEGKPFVLTLDDAATAAALLAAVAARARRG
nr:DUF1648 domain-containing protein [Gordonia humi]